jgi:1-acyl-sn-glycerol-3-phosphate acyltransferase
MKFPFESSITWKLSHIVMRSLRPLLCSLSVEGLEHLPLQGGVVLACNHPGGTDSFVLGFASGRQVYYMTKRELFNVHPVATQFLHGIGAFPVDRGARDFAAIEHSVNLLRKGHVLGMFPEGTRNRGKPLRRGKSGAVRIALEADVPVVPVAVLGIPHLHENWRNPFKRTQLSVRFGEPLRFPKGSVENVQEYTTEVMLAIARLLPPELRGHYGETTAPSKDRSLQRPGDAASFGPKGAGDSTEDIATN